MAIGKVHPSDLIEFMAQDMNSNLKVEQPAFTIFAKTGPHRERAPSQSDWYYLRLSSLLYRLHKEGNAGVGGLRSYYGGRKSRGTKPHKHVNAAGKIIRVALRQLESLGFVEKTKKGRKLSVKGKSYLSSKAKELLAKWPDIMKEREIRKLEQERKLEQLAQQAKREDSKQPSLKKKKSKDEPENTDKDKPSKQKK